MSSAGERLLRGAMQALDYAEGRAEASTYRVHDPKSADVDALVAAGRQDPPQPAESAKDSAESPENPQPLDDSEKVAG